MRNESLLVLLFVLIGFNLASQCPNDYTGFDYGLSSTYDICNPYYEASINQDENCWNASHGSPHFSGPTLMLESDNTGGEGVYRPIQFIGGQDYEIWLTLSKNTVNVPRVRVFLTKDLTPTELSECVPESQPSLSSVMEVSLVKYISETEFFQTNEVNDSPGEEGSYRGNFTIDVGSGSNQDGYNQIWILSEEGYDATLNINYVNIQLDLPNVNSHCVAPLEIVTSINDSENAYLYACIGEPLMLDVSESNYYRRAEIQVQEIENGEVVNDTHRRPIGENGRPGLVVDLYKFVHDESDTFGGEAWTFEPGKEYRVKVAFSCPNRATQWAFHTLYFRDSEAKFNFINPSGIHSEYSSSGNWSVDVEELCASTIMIDASESSCYNRSRIHIEEFDIDNWTSIGTTAYTAWNYLDLGIEDYSAYWGSNEENYIYYSTPVNPDDFTNTLDVHNLNQIYGIFQVGHTYRVVVETGLPYDSESRFFTVVSPSSAAQNFNGDFQKIKYEEVLSPTYENFSYSHHYVCPVNDEYNFVFSDTEGCYNRYKVTLSRFNADLWSLIPNTSVSSGWIIGTLPEQIDLELLYESQLEIGETYLLDVKVESADNYKAFVFTPLSSLDGCISKPDSDRKKTNVVVQATNSSGQLITFSDLMVNVDYLYTIYNLNGQVLDEGKVETSSNRAEINTAALPQGIYIARLISSDGNINTVKFFVN